eukprot:2744216-Pyramimonas_sp.AAC.1
MDAGYVAAGVVVASLVLLLLPFTSSFVVIYLKAPFNLRWDELGHNLHEEEVMLGSDVARRSVRSEQ